MGEEKLDSIGENGKDQGEEDGNLLDDADALGLNENCDDTNASEKVVSGPIEPLKQEDREGQEKTRFSSGHFVSRIGKKRLVIGTVVIVVGLAAIVAILFASHIICFHEHVADATCTEASVCQDCGRLQGEPLGHDYAPATCYKPKTCVRCGNEEGSRLDHAPGEWEERVDPVSGKLTRAQECTACGALINSKTEPLDTLYSGGDFIFTPAEFAKRAERALDTIESELGLSYTATLGSLDDKTACAILDSRGSQIAGIVFFDDGSEYVKNRDSKNVSGFMCVKTNAGNSDDFAIATCALLMAIDPSLDLVKSLDVAIDTSGKALTGDVHAYNGVKYGMEKDGETLYAVLW